MASLLEEQSKFHPMLYSPDTRDYEEARAATYDPPRDPQTPTSAPLVRALDTCKSTAKKNCETLIKRPLLFRLSSHHEVFISRGNCVTRARALIDRKNGDYG